ALKLDFAELARRVADAQPLLAELTQTQEKAVVADKKLLLVAICVLSQWTLEQITAAYRLTEAEGVKYLAQLDRLGIIELRPLNRYRLKLAKTFRWRAHGPVMDFFREHALLDYYSGGFDDHGEGLLLVHGSIARSLAPSFVERLQRVAQDFAQQHQTDQKLPEKEREGYTLVLAMRSWEFEAFSALRR
ncbi:MAG: XRE family transcriptional regulator, partial [Burkholderiaceae bacterium]|nr:XRE family transcriptional regulator [Burkholderiaceae bacterium]